LNNIYIEYIKRKLEINESLKAELSVGLLAQNLLECIAIENEKGRPMKVGEALSLVKLGSQATLHRKLNELRLAGLIELRYQGSDRRTKYLVPTQAANEYFKKMGNALIQALTWHS
jgi:DNA-binding transcriptional ArsR family regulator